MIAKFCKKSKKRIRLVLSYKGTQYYGWQRQKNQPSLQGTIEQALKQLLREDVVLVGAGRTDKGVHAFGQSAHFDILQPLPLKLDLKTSLNALLEHKDIQILRAWRAPLSFHALQSATSKSYKYFILNRNRPCIFRKDLLYWYPFPLDIESLNRISRPIEGRHNFKSFQNQGTVVKSTIRKIHLACWQDKGRGVKVFHIKGEGFLKQMIRNIVGTQLMILSQNSLLKGSATIEVSRFGRKNMEYEVAKKNILKQWQGILRAKDRKWAGPPAPAEGLYLCKVYYPLELDKQCVPL